MAAILAKAMTHGVLSTTTTNISGSTTGCLPNLPFLYNSVLSPTTTSSPTSGDRLRRIWRPSQIPFHFPFLFRSCFWKHPRRISAPFSTLRVSISSFSFARAALVGPSHQPARTQRARHISSLPPLLGRTGLSPWGTRTPTSGSLAQTWRPSFNSARRVCGWSV